MDPPVFDELGERDFSDLSPYRVEAGDRHGIWGVIYDDVNPGGSLDSSDIASFTADDTTLHIIVGEGDNGGGILRNHI